MSAENGDDGPKVVWTFPLIRMLTSRNRLISRQDGEVQLGKNIKNARSKVRDRVSERRESLTSSSDDDEEEDKLDEIANQIDDINSNRRFSFTQNEEVDADVTVDIEEGVFVPVRTKIEPGETVAWINNDDSPHRVLSISGLDFGSGRLEPGEAYTHTFDDEEVVIYIDPITGRQQMCGAIIVGDVEEDFDLPCEQEIDAQLFEQEHEYAERGRSMAQAAEDKDNMESGF